MPRWLNVLFALLGLVIASPVLLAAAVLIKLTSPGPILFRQTRVGLHGRPFTLYKLRTMRADVRGPGVTTWGDRRVTPIGRFLRFFKIDEIPELWNVVRGDMALVGPRPEVPEYVNLEDPRWRRVLEVRPGLTDPVTLRLRNEERLLAESGGDPVQYYREVLQPWKLQGYIEYLNERNGWRDFGVLWATVAAVFFPGRARGQANKPPNTGN